MSKPRLLIEEWLPVQALSVECMRERGASSALPPINFLHVWWARRPLTISRAAILGSLVPADFDRELFERLLGFYGSSSAIVENNEKLAANGGGARIKNPHGPRAFGNIIREKDIAEALSTIRDFWGEAPTIIDPMSGGGSIPFEGARLGLDVLANELNPVACTVLEATLDYPFKFGPSLAEKARPWAARWREQFNKRMERFYEVKAMIPAYSYIFARTVPCPETGHPTPLVPDWSLLRPIGGAHIVAEPVVTDAAAGMWTIRVREVGKGAGQLRQSPQPTYGRGSGVSLFAPNVVIPDDYIKAMAQQGKMGNVLYAVATKATTRLEFRPADVTDQRVLEDAQKELERIRPQWEREGVIPDEEFPTATSDERPRLYGMPRWADMFSHRQLLALGVLVEELHNIRTEIVRKEGEQVGEAIVHLLAFVIDKFANHNCSLSKWECTRGVIKGKFDRHDYAFRATFAEFAACVAGGGFEWTIDNVLEAYQKIAELPRSADARSVAVSQGSASSLIDLDSGTITAVVVDPPYADNVQYSELADFFYVWLKRTQGYRHTDWFSTYLSDHDQEAVVNVSRYRNGGTLKASQAREMAHEFYQSLMTDVFREAHRILKDDGVLTVMFTHKQQSAWAALFDSLIDAGFTITATFPVQTESQYSLHQAQKNAAQSTVILVSRKRDVNAGMQYYDEAMQEEIRQVARQAAARLKDEGLNAVDQLVGAFGPAMEVFSRYDEVRRDTGESVDVSEAIQAAADAVAQWRVEQLAKRGLDGVDPESRFYLLCWDVLGAAEFRFNEASLLGRAVGMDVSRLKETGLVSSTGEKVKMLPASDRRREKPVKSELEQLTLIGGNGRKKSGTSRKVHPSDEFYSSAIDMCHALAMRFSDGLTEQNGIANAKTLANQQGWGADSSCAKLMTALVEAAPMAVRFAGKGKKKTAADEFPEFRAWYAILKDVFGIQPPEWKEQVEISPTLPHMDEEEDEEESGEE